VGRCPRTFSPWGTFLLVIAASPIPKESDHGLTPCGLLNIQWNAKQTRNFAWQCWTNVRQLAGHGLFRGIGGSWMVRFDLAAKFITKPRGGEANQRRAEDVPRWAWRCGSHPRPRRSPTLCLEHLRDAGKRTTRLTQQATIEGAAAQNYLSDVAEWKEQFHKECNASPRQSSSSPWVQPWAAGCASSKLFMGVRRSGRRFNPPPAQVQIVFDEHRKSPQ